jgi:apolipoprotein D and lipocalin family protein
MKTVEYVDLPKFMGDWYVIANIPTFIERNAYNAVETYALNDAGEIETTFTFRAGGFDGPLKTYRPKGFIKDEQSNALWAMQFIWPIKADYRIVYLNDKYSQVIIGRRARDYVWVMARTPEIPDQDYNRLINKVKELGYDIEKLARVPQQWPTNK